VAQLNIMNAPRVTRPDANDCRQIQIERELRKFDYLYIRKRQTRAEARRTKGVSH
jgi:hypothetical protein